MDLFRETVADLRWALTVCLAMYAAIAVLYVTAPAPAVPVFTPASVYFCPAGQHLVSPDGPQCARAPEPLPAVPIAGLEGK